MASGPDLATLKDLLKSREEARKSAERAEKAARQADALVEGVLKSLSPVATSGRWNDLKDRPAIPASPADIGAAPAEIEGLARSAVQPADLAAFAAQVQRPGVNPALFADSPIAADAGACPGTTETNERGTVRRIGGGKRMVLRQAVPIVGPSTLWRGTVALSRKFDPVAAAGRVVEVSLVWLSITGSELDPTPVFNGDLLEANGLLEVDFTFGSALGADYAPPLGAADATLQVVTHDEDDGRTDVEVMYISRENAGNASRLARLERAEVGFLAVVPGVGELGETLHPGVKWTVIGDAPVAAQQVNGAPVTPGVTEFTDNADVTDDKTYTVAVVDSLGRLTSASVEIDFQYRVFWGTSEDESLDADGVLALSGTALLARTAQSISFDSAAGKYVFFAFPSAVGIPVYVFANDTPTDVEVSEVILTTGAGYTGPYTVIRLPEQMADDDVAVTLSWKEWRIAKG